MSIAHSNEDDIEPIFISDDDDFDGYIEQKPSTSYTHEEDSMGYTDDSMGSISSIYKPSSAALKQEPECKEVVCSDDSMDSISSIYKPSTIYPKQEPVSKEDDYKIHMTNKPSCSRYIKEEPEFNEEVVPRNNDDCEDVSSDESIKIIEDANPFFTDEDEKWINGSGSSRKAKTKPKSLGSEENNFSLVEYKSEACNNYETEELKCRSPSIEDSKVLDVLEVPIRRSYKKSCEDNCSFCIEKRKPKKKRSKKRTDASCSTPNRNCEKRLSNEGNWTQSYSHSLEYVVKCGKRLGLTAKDVEFIISRNVDVRKRQYTRSTWHNILEQFRRKGIVYDFIKLQKLVPSICSDPKVPKYEILSKAVNFIYELEKKNKDLTAELAYVRAKRLELLKTVTHLSKEVYSKRLSKSVLDIMQQS